MKNYKVEITESSKELTSRERIMLKDTNNALSIDEISQECKFNDENFVIYVESYAILSIHNEYAENKEYEVLLLVDYDGKKYITGSKSFRDTFLGIADELDINEEFKIIVNRSESKNYKGKEFLTCSLI